MTIRGTDDRPIVGAQIDEWIFAAWTPDGSAGVISGHRILGRRAWYWSAHVRAGFPLLHLTEWDVKVRPDPMVVKAPEMWAEHACDQPLTQWSIGNEAYFVGLDDPSDALGRAYGVPTPTAFDLEWYATSEPITTAATPIAGVVGDIAADLVDFTQSGVVHGLVEVLGRTDMAFTEIPARRWRRASSHTTLPPPQLDAAVAHIGVRAPFAFPDGPITDWVLTTRGWCARTPMSGADAMTASNSP